MAFAFHVGFCLIKALQVFVHYSSLSTESNCRSASSPSLYRICFSFYPLKKGKRIVAIICISISRDVFQLDKNASKILYRKEIPAMIITLFGSHIRTIWQANMIWLTTQHVIFNCHFPQCMLHCISWVDDELMMLYFIDNRFFKYCTHNIPPHGKQGQ